MIQFVKNITLRPATSDDAEVLYQWRQEPKVQQFNPLEDLSLENLRVLLLKTNGDLRDRSTSNFRWIAELNGTPIGTTSLNNPSWRMGYAEIGYGLGEQFHNQGLGTILVQRFVEKIFFETDLCKVIAYVAEDNIASRRILSRLNFEQEGFLKEHFLIQGRRVNEVLYALHRNKFESSSMRSV